MHRKYRIAKLPQLLKALLFFFILRYLLFSLLLLLLRLVFIVIWQLKLQHRAGPIDVVYHKSAFDPNLRHYFFPFTIQIKPLAHLWQIDPLAHVDRDAA